MYVQKCKNLVGTYSILLKIPSRNHCTIKFQAAVKQIKSYFFKLNVKMSGVRVILVLQNSRESAIAHSNNTRSFFNICRSGGGGRTDYFLRTLLNPREEVRKREKSICLHLLVGLSSQAGSKSKTRIVDKKKKEGFVAHSFPLTLFSVEEVEEGRGRVSKGSIYAHEASLGPHSDLREGRNIY
jgi:hypothetical protein